MKKLIFLSTLLFAGTLASTTVMANPISAFFNAISGKHRNSEGGVQTYRSSGDFKTDQIITGKVFIFDPKQHKWAAYNENGRLVASGKASGGANYCYDIDRSCRTPVGVFRVHQMGPPDCISRKYPLGEGGAPMPYCMYFNGGYAVHGSYDVPSNRNVSHGCIRITPEAARWLHQNFMSVGTKVIVKSYSE